ncbi:hypothetical protein GEMRC1_006817 [Eukaryota sp. GEM-RC1]
MKKLSWNTSLLYQMKIVLITLVIALAYAGCRCPSICSAGYSGSVVDCFCWCQRTAESMKAAPDARCTHYPRATFSSGGCALCASNINTANTETSAVEVYESSLSEAIMGIPKTMT